MTKLAHSYSALKQYENCPKRYYMQRISKEIKDKPGEASIIGERIHKHLEDRLKSNTPLPPESAAYEELVRAFASLPGEVVAEQEFCLNESLSPTGWWDADAWLRAKLDVLVIHDADAVVGDWKTGKRRPDFFQMELFAILVMKLYPDVQRVKTCLVWLKTNEMDTREFTRDDAPALWNKLLSKVKQIEHSLEKDRWPAKPSGLCPWCPATPAHCEFK